MKLPGDIHAGRRRRRRYFFICGFGPSVHDHEFDPTPQTSPDESLPTISFCSRLRCRSKTVPVEEITDDRRIDAGSPEIATVRCRSNGFLQKLFKKKCKATAKPLLEKSKSKHQQLTICHASTRNFRTPPPAPLKRVLERVQSGIGSTHPGSPNPIPSASQTIAPAARQLDSAYIFLLVMAALAALLFFGRLFAVFCTCFWLSLLPRSLPAPAAMPPVMCGAEAVDISSPAYKKKVVLMGLLERNK